MRRYQFFTLLFILFGLFAGESVKADYCSSYQNYNPSVGRERTLTSFSLSDGMRAVSVDVNQTTTKGVSLFFDRTSTVFYTVSGRTLSFSSLLWEGGYMHAYMFIDYDRNGVYNQTLNRDGTNNGELVSYSYYKGTDSSGKTVPDDAGVSTSKMPSFTLPAIMEGGDYRVRFKIDWNNTDPCGASDLGTNGGVIVDFVINIPVLESRTITVESSNTAHGTVSGGGSGTGPITCTATPNSGYSFTSWKNKETGNIVSVSATYIDNTDGDKTLVAYFTKQASELPRNGWSATADNWASGSGGADGPASQAIDGNLAKWWHSRYGSEGGGTTTYTYPHWIQFDLGSSQSFSEFNYVSRSGHSSGDPSNGNVGDYKLYVSDKDISKNLDASYNPTDAKLISSGKFSYSGKTTPEDHKIGLAAPAKGRYVFMRCASAINGANFAGCNEFYLYSGWIKVKVSANDAGLGSVYIDTPGVTEKEVQATGEGSVSVTAEPEDGALFRGWMAEGRPEIVSTDNPYVINSIDKDYNLIANFGTKPLVQHKIEVSVNPAGAGTVQIDGVDAPSVVEAGKTATLRAKPARGYMLESWEQAGKLVGTESSFVTPAVASDLSYKANFTVAKGKSYINDLDLTKGTCGGGKQITANKSMKGNPLTLKGVVYDRGISMQSPAKLIIQTNKSTRFHAVVGIDDDCDGSAGKGACDYKVIRDGGEVVKSGSISRGDAAPVTIDIDVTTWNYLTLEISNGAGGSSAENCADWVDAYFDFEGILPEAVTEDEVAANQLKLACAKRLFSLPNVKMMHKLKAEDSNAEIAVLNLPSGLTFNTRRNLIEGKVTVPGTYEYYVVTTTPTQTKKHKITLTVDEDIPFPTPQMGWLSWNVFEHEISEQKLIETTDAFVREGLVELGYKYINIDDKWHAASRASDGKPRYDSAKFPRGIKYVSDYVHSKNMKIGIYSDAANVTCGGMFGSYGYETIDAKQYAEWEIDLLKYDYCGAPNDQKTAIQRYTTMGDALKATGRDFCYNICEWGQLQPWDWASEAGGHCWRATYDTRDTWTYGAGANGLIGVIEGLDEMNKIAYYNGVNRYNDADMMMVGLYGTGKSSNYGNNGKGMTDTEYRTQLSMWCMYATPLWLSFDVRNINDATRTMLKNKELIDINQDLMGQSAILIRQSGGADVYLKDLENGDIAVALLNRNSTSQQISIGYDDLFLDNPGMDYVVRDLWEHKDVDMADRTLKADVASHETKVYRIRGVLNSVEAANVPDAGYKVTVNKNDIKIECLGDEGRHKHVTVSDMSARLIAAKDSADDTITVPVSLSDGIYIVNIVCDGKSYSEKVRAK